MLLLLSTLCFSGWAAVHFVLLRVSCCPLLRVSTGQWASFLAHHHHHHWLRLAQGGQLPLFVENGFDLKPPIKSSSIRSSMHFQKGYINQHNTGVQISFNEYSRKTTPSKQFLAAYSIRSWSSLWFIIMGVLVKSGVLMIYADLWVEIFVNTDCLYLHCPENFVVLF